MASRVSRSIALPFLDRGIRWGGEWSTVRPNRTLPGTHCTGGCYRKCRRKFGRLVPSLSFPFKSISHCTYIPLYCPFRLLPRLALTGTWDASVGLLNYWRVCNKAHTNLLFTFFTGEKFNSIFSNTFAHLAISFVMWTVILYSRVININSWRFMRKQVLVRTIVLGVKGGRWVGMTTLSHSYADCLEILELKLPGTLRACPGLYRNWFTFTFAGLSDPKQL
jgi:hypothetical protein